MRHPKDPGRGQGGPLAEADAGEERFAGRWSRRKHAARSAPEPQRSAPQAPPPTRREPPGELPGEPQEIDEPPGDADMPPVESITDHSDVSGFFSPRVTEALRKKALRQLFRTSKFNFRDGLDDYDGDYRSFEPLGDVMTADLRHQLERQAELAKALLEQEAPPAEPTDAAGVEVVVTADAGAAAPTDHPENEAPDPDAADDRSPSPGSRNPEVPS